VVRAVGAGMVGLLGGRGRAVLHGPVLREVSSGVYRTGYYYLLLLPLAGGRADGRLGKAGKGGQHQRTGGHIVRNTYLKGWGGFASLFGSPVRGLLSYLILSFSAFLFFSFGHLYSYLEFRVRSLLA